MSSLVATRSEGVAPLTLESTPPAIRALAPRVVHVVDRPRIVLEACFDHFVIMSFHGLPGDPLGGEPSIELVWGEHSDAGSKTLWHPES
jgi:hypothetical protein